MLPGPLLAKCGHRYPIDPSGQLFSTTNPVLELALVILGIEIAVGLDDTGIIRKRPGLPTADSDGMTLAFRAAIGAFERPTEYGTTRRCPNVVHMYDEVRELEKNPWATPAIASRQMR